MTQKNIEIVRETVRSFCPVCPKHCAVLQTFEGGYIVDMKPDEQAEEEGFHADVCPYKKGSIIAKDLPLNPNRLKYPLKRVGDRGEDGWERISWDEALDTIAGKMIRYKQMYGPESIAFGLGEPKSLEFALAQRLATAFGTPNVATPGYICGEPRVHSMVYTFGRAFSFTMAGTPKLIKEPYPKLILVWGWSLVHTWSFQMVNAALKAGANTIVIDPHSTGIAYYRKEEREVGGSEADIWIKPKPGSDGCLALGMIKTIIEEELFDKEFVEKWAHGFEEMKEHVNTFTYDDVERYTWVPKAQFQAAARMYATTKPAVMLLGNGIEMTSTALQDARAMNIMKALCGQVNLPGGERFISRPKYYPPGRFFLLSKIGRKPDKAAGKDLPVAMESAYTPYPLLAKAILTEKPAPIKMAIVLVANPLITAPNAKQIYDAFRKLEFVVVSELFMTPTAMLADIVLPAQHMVEHPGVSYWISSIRTYPRGAKSPGETWADEKWIIALAQKLGLNEYFPWEAERWEEVYDFWLEPAGMAFKEYIEKQRGAQPEALPGHEEIGFGTPTKKAEIYSETLKNLGYSPIPMWEELLQSTAPYMPTEEYPLVMFNSKDYPFISSMYRSVPGLREKSRYPRVGLHPDTAKKLGLEEGNWAYIENRQGRIRQMVKIDPKLDPRMVDVAFGWWYPEQQSNLHGWSESNVNILVPSEPFDVVTGSMQTHGLPVKVYKAEGG
ncbi:MAG TPA: molybdopterin-dependent oxidoreductase [Dehalococcoidia bacterium]|nr:molybdopterin-dependent oxidoreductase [Dehalococcoidia bacterium]